jgi:phosphoribosylaminoimidazolecarboxamide formyltransferase/IMP cyclohydrolase
VTPPVLAAVFASGSGTNLQALLDHETPNGPYRIVVFISDREGAGAFERAESAGRVARVIGVTGRPSDEVATETLALLESLEVGAIFLAGYLRLIPPAVVAAYPRRILNIHPARLPAFGGKGMFGEHVHEAVLASGAEVSGATVHYVDEEYDNGIIVGQWSVRVLPDDDVSSLAARVLSVEHRLYPAVADHVCEAWAEGRTPDPFALSPEEASSELNQEVSWPRKLKTDGDDIDMKRRALLSVSDKTGIEDFAKALVDAGWEILSTGGTAGVIREAGVEVTDVAQVTGHPEMMDGRVKTLHPAIHAGLLARRARSEDMAALSEQGYAPIDLVAVNLYPFRETVSRGHIPVGEAMGRVDIGGPTMIRAAAKSHVDVWVVVDPADYDRVLEEITGGGGSSEAHLRRELAAKVFGHVSAYDGAIARYLEERNAPDGSQGRDPDQPDASLSLDLELVQGLRYGENPGQKAAFYRWPGRKDGLSGLEQIHGTSMSYNNLLDLDGAILSLSPFAYSPKAAVCIVKHTTPCGLAIGDSVESAYERALATDGVSAFGSVISVNRRIEGAAAEAMSSLFIECLVAPGFDEPALEILTRKKNVRLVVYGGIDEPLPGEPKSGSWVDASDQLRRTARFLAEHGRRPDARVIRSVYGGVLVQGPPPPPFYGRDCGDWSVATSRAPNEEEWDDLRFAWAAVFGVKSNAILFARGGSTLGIGAGQMSRVDASRIAVQKAADAGLELDGAALASDAFFPFRDGVDAAAEAGARAIVQPGGSVRDVEVIEAANEHGMAMVFTGQRLFRH